MLCRDLFFLPGRRGYGGRTLRRCRVRDSPPRYSAKGRRGHSEWPGRPARFSGAYFPAAPGRHSPEAPCHCPSLSSSGSRAFSPARSFPPPDRRTKVILPPDFLRTFANWCCIAPEGVGCGFASRRNQMQDIRRRLVAQQTYELSSETRVRERAPGASDRNDVDPIATLPEHGDEQIRRCRSGVVAADVDRVGLGQGRWWRWRRRRWGHGWRRRRFLRWRRRWSRPRRHAETANPDRAAASDQQHQGGDGTLHSSSAAAGSERPGTVSGCVFRNQCPASPPDGLPRAVNALKRRPDCAAFDAKVGFCFLGGLRPSVPASAGRPAGGPRPSPRPARPDTGVPFLVRASGPLP